MLCGSAEPSRCCPSLLAYEEHILSVGIPGDAPKL